MIRLIVSFSLLLLVSASAFAASDVAALYADNCSSCHAATRLGGTGPALIPESLSSLRGDAVKAYLVSQGIDANRIKTEGRGKSQPVADNATAEGRAKNRRVELVKL